MSGSVLSPFPTTHWAVVAEAGGGKGDAARVALANVLERYLPAMRSYLVARFRLSPHWVDDVLQGFLADKLLEQEILGQADRARGRFRAFLVTALHRYAISRLRKEQAQRPPHAAGSGDGDRSALVAAEPSPPSPPDAFDVAWARQVLELALRQTRNECEAGGRPELWAVFEGRVLMPTIGQGEPVPVEELAERLCGPPEKVSNLLVTGKRMFARNLKAVVAAYAADEQDAEDELRHLRRILERAGA